MRHFLTLAVFALLVLPVAAQAGDGWARADLAERAEGLLGMQVELTPVGGLPGNLFLLDPTEEASCFLSAGDRAWAFTAGDFSQVLLVGSGDTIHTVWMYFPIVSVQDTDKAFAFFDGFFSELFPDWAGAAGWSQKSLGDAWSKGGAAYRDPMISLNETIARVTVDGARLATSGVPPDLVTYRITTRTECEKVSDYLLAKPRRAQCDPDRVVPEGAGRQVLLYNTRPHPIDRSETPFFLGSASAQTFRSEALELDLPGGLHSGPLEWNTWFARQMQGELSLEQILSEDWLCAQYFIYLISAPEIAPGKDGSWLLSVESVSAFPTRRARTIDYREPSMVSGLVFSRDAPVTPPRPPSLDPPYMLVGEGRTVFETEGDATPVDVSDVPLQLGQVSIRFGETAVPEYLPIDGRLEGTSFVLTSRATGATTTVDLGEWLERQRGVAPAPDRARPISDPELAFELDGRRFMLVLDAVDFEGAAGEGLRAAGLSGYLFGSR